MKSLLVLPASVKSTLEACRRNGKCFFISYRMNDQHYVGDLTWSSDNNSELPTARAGDNVGIFRIIAGDLSGDPMNRAACRLSNQHDSDHATFHRVRDVRKLALQLTPDPED